MSRLVTISASGMYSGSFYTNLIESVMTAGMAGLIIFLYANITDS